MGRTFIRQDAQIRESVTYDDTLAAGVALETGAGHIEDDLNGLRSQVNKIIGETNWYDLPNTDLATVTTDITTLEGQKFLCRANVLTDVTVTAAQNWEILSVAGSEAPTKVAAVASTVLGAVVAQSALSGAGFNVHELIEFAGPDALSPSNLLLVHDKSTGQQVQSLGRDVFGLLQYESTGADGGAFNDTSAGNRAKISFIRYNATFDDFEACPVADIAGTTVRYSYIFRSDLATLPEECLLPGFSFVDQSASTDVTLDRALDNQSGLATQTQTVDWDIADGSEFAWTSDSGATDLVLITPTGGGDTIAINGDTLDINNPDIDMSSGPLVDSAGTPISLGNSNAGVIETTGADDLRVLGAGELLLDDGNQTGSTWAQTTGIKLSETTAEWDAFETNFGEVSLLNAINQSLGMATRTKGVAVLTADVSADGNVTGAAALNLDAQLPDYSTVTFVSDVEVFLNGELMRNGADATANHDVYPGTAPSTGDLKFEFALKGTGSKPDVLTMIVNGA